MAAETFCFYFDGEKTLLEKFYFFLFRQIPPEAAFVLIVSCKILKNNASGRLCITAAVRSFLIDFE